MKTRPQTRYEHAVERITFEALWLFNDHTALVHLIGVDSLGLDFFRVAANALLGDLLVRLARVFEDKPKQVASFWYLHKCNNKPIEQVLIQCGGSLDDLKDFSRRIKGIRDQTLVHIDKQRVKDRQGIYQQAGIRGREVEQTVHLLWAMMQAVYRDTFGQPFSQSPYSGQDIAAFVKCRDAARAAGASWPANFC